MYRTDSAKHNRHVISRVGGGGVRKAAAEQLLLMTTVVSKHGVLRRLSYNRVPDRARAR